MKRHFSLLLAGLCLLAPLAQAQTAWVPDLSYTMQAGFTYANAAAELSRDNARESRRSRTPARPQAANSARRLSILWGTDLREAAERMAADSDTATPEQREMATRLFRRAGDAYCELPGSRCQHPTLPGGVAMLVAGSYALYHGEPLEAGALAALTRQLETEARANPAPYAGLSEAEMEATYLKSVISGMMMYQAVESGDQASMRRLRGAAEQLLEAVFKTSADRVRITANGLETRRR